MAQMKSFKSRLAASGTAVLDSRAESLYEITKIENERYVQDKKMEVLRLQTELNKLQDLSITSTDSLTPGGQNFNAKVWVNNRHALAQNLRIARIEYALALQVTEEEFPQDSLALDLETDSKKALAEDSKE